MSAVRQTMRYLRWQLVCAWLLVLVLQATLIVSHDATLPATIGISTIALLALAHQGRELSRRT
jgi:hypothetical protein